jgi:hypothetical protein
MNRGVDVDYIRQRGGSGIVEQHIQTVNDVRNAGGRSNDNVIRAYVPTHQQLTARANSSVHIQHATRTSSLDVSKVNMSPRVNNVQHQNKVQMQNKVQPQNKVQNTTPAKINNANLKHVNKAPMKTRNAPQKMRSSGGNRGSRNNSGGGRR